MSEGKEDPMKSSCVNLAVLAAVDAGKTTLSESFLYLTGTIRKAGRVDHQDSFLDTHELERRRGITIFSKMARLRIGDTDITLLDTPGHVDFTAETERTLAVADMALLLISAADGVTGHTLELWKLLERYHLPTLIFVNKMDQAGADLMQVEKDLQEHLDEHCITFQGWEERDPDLCEQIAMCSEDVLESYLESGTLTDEEVQNLAAGRALFPVYCGSALKMEGVQELIDGIAYFSCRKEYPDKFGALCYKISRDEKGNRLTWLKLTGGSMKVRGLLAGNLESPATRSEETDEQAPEDNMTFEPAGSGDDAPVPAAPAEKVTQIRLYSGEKFTSADEAFAGQIVAVTGLNESFCTQTYGICSGTCEILTQPVLSYDLIWPENIDRLQMYGKMKELSEEIPEIEPQLDDRGKAIHIRVMGEVQTEILQSIVQSRYGVAISFGEGRIVYKETIRSCAEGVGHFEPLRHYAEVHLILEPGERGSGIQYDSACSTDILARHWQRLILNMLKAHRQVGVLTGSELTDVKVTLISGRAHLKHTVGGDFRQAGRRALRQGLMKCESVLLEPYYDFVLDIPAAQIGRAILDIGNFAGHADPPETDGTFARITGYAPVSTMRNYQADVRAYTSGRGALTLKMRGYEPCHNPEEVIAQYAYEPERDLRNPPWSVFCAHGAGYEVPWEEVDAMAHVPLMSSSRASGEMLWNYGEEDISAAAGAPGLSAGRDAEGTDDWQQGYENYRRHEASSEELQSIFERTYGKIVRKDLGGYKENFFGGGRHGPSGMHRPRKKDNKEPILLVDGYNIIYAWEQLRSLAGKELNAARTKLAEILSNYQGFTQTSVILVFDAYKVPGGVERVEKYHDIFIIYTKEAETADRYIEKAVHRMGSEFDITVATSDNAEQLIIWGAGARRYSASDLKEEVDRTEKELRTDYLNAPVSGKNRPFADLLSRENFPDSND